MAKIDHYLLQSLRADKSNPELPTTGMFHTVASATALGGDELTDTLGPMFEELRIPSERETRIPLLIRVDSEDWNAEDIPGMTISSRLGPIISAMGTTATIEALQRADGVISVDASRPFEFPGELANSLPLVGATMVHANHQEKGDGAIVAVIDGGIDVLHEAFRGTNSGTRILAVWDQRDSSHAPAAHPMGYGTLHVQADIDGYITAGATPPGLDRDVRGHGTHVASIAAGRAAGAFSGGMAPEASLIIVCAEQQRFEDGQVSSLGYSHNHVDALAWIREMAIQHGKGVAVNVSLGMNAGAHDGSSLLEVAFDEFSSGGRAPGRVIVKSAGNEGGKNGHAQLNLVQNGNARVSWRSRNVLRDQDVIELWYRSQHNLEFHIENPRGEISGSVSVNVPIASGQFSNGDNFDLDVDRLHQDNGYSRLLIRIHRGGRPAAFEVGQWILNINALRVIGACRIDAWIERRGSNPRPLEFTNYQVSDYCLSIPSTANTVIAVGSLETQAPYGAAGSSSRGPTRDEREKPEVAAPGNGILAAEGGTGNGSMVKAGTSMAAPHVTGALALLLSHWLKQEHAVADWRQLNAVQMRSALINTCRGFNGSHDKASGFGRLDVEGLVNYFT